MRIAIIGNSGSGKSTLAGKIAVSRGLPMLDLDTVAWEPGKVAVARAEAAAISDVKIFCEANPHWVIEGCYAGLIHAALQFSPTLLFLEPGVEACLANCCNRPLGAAQVQVKARTRRETGVPLFVGSRVLLTCRRLVAGCAPALFDAYPGPKHKLTTLVEQKLIDGSMTVKA